MTVARAQLWSTARPNSTQDTIQRTTRRCCGGLRDADATCDVHRCNMRRASMQHAPSSDATCNTLRCSVQSASVQRAICMHQRRCKVQRCDVYTTQRATTQQTTDHPMQRATCIDATCKRQRRYKVQQCSLQHATCSHATKARPRNAMLPIHGPHGLVTVHEPRSRRRAPPWGDNTAGARIRRRWGRGWRTAKPCVQQPRRH